MFEPDNRWATGYRKAQTELLPGKALSAHNGLSAELTWGETTTDKPKETAHRFNKVAVLSSRPMTFQFRRHSSR